MTTSEYGEIDRQFLKYIVTTISVLFIMWMYIIDRGELICLSVISVFWLHARRGGPRSIIVVIAAFCGLAFYLLGYLEDSLPQTYKDPSIYYYGYCKGISEPIHYNIDFHCPDGSKPLPAPTQWHIQMMKDYPMLNKFLFILPSILPFLFAVLALIAYLYSPKKLSLKLFFKRKKGMIL